jgi:hypothetical protein
MVCEGSDWGSDISATRSIRRRRQHGGFTGPLDKAEIAARKSGKGIADSANMASLAWTALGEVVAGAVAGFSVGAVLTSFITETRDAEKEQAQLAAVLKSTGESAGFSRD